MSNMEVVGVILAGGSGTRLWPLSRKFVPKQLLMLTGNRTLLQETCRRASAVVGYDRQWIITNEQLYFLVSHQLNSLMEEVGKKDAVQIMKEPVARNTAPAILWAAFRCRKMYGNDAIMVVLPSDHVIANEKVFADILNQGIFKAREGCLLAFGIVPTHPESVYGYIKTNRKPDSSNNIFALERFIEKPDKDTALKLITEEGCLWNSGMYIFHTGTLLEEVLKYCPGLYRLFDGIDPDDEGDIKQAFEGISPISIDYAIMEHTKKACVIKADIGWSDVGNWNSLYEAGNKNENGNVIIGGHINIDTKESYIYGKDRLIVTVGLNNMAIIDTEDALLVTPLNQSYRIKEVVDKLESTKTPDMGHFVDERPWGKYIVLQTGQGYKIKRMLLNPKEKLCRQYHNHRSEHWVVLRGIAKVTKEDMEYYLHDNESTFIPAGTVHCLENPGPMPLEIIETQCGHYLEEDDIVGLDDVFV